MNFKKEQAMNTSDIKHIIVLHLAVKRLDDQGYVFERLGMSWDQWLKKSIYLMDKYCRPSLRNQTCQDFTLLTFVDSSVNEFGNVLPNEKVIKIDEGLDEADKKVAAINEYLSDAQRMIITRLDRDDLLHKDYTKHVRDHFEMGAKGYIDIFYSFSFDMQKGIFYDSPKYNWCISPFVSVLEERQDNGFTCLPYRVGHPQTGHYVTGIKSRHLSSIQGIHDHNVLNKVQGVRTKINKPNYGI